MSDDAAFVQGVETTELVAAGGRPKMDLVCQLGAAVAVDYTEPEWAARVRAEVGALDVVFDGVGGHIGTTSFGLVAEGGRFVPYGIAGGTFTPIPEPEAASRHIAVLRSTPRGVAALNELARRALDAGSAVRLRPTIGQSFPLDRAADAHAAIAARATVGKTLLVVRPGHALITQPEMP